MAAIIASAACMAAVLGPLAAPGVAGTYTATDCHAANPYTAASNGEYGHHMLYWSADCRAGGTGLGVALPQAYPAWGYGHWLVSAPPDTRFISISGAMRGVSADGWVALLRAGTGGGYVEAGPYNFGTWQGFGFGSGSYGWYQVLLVCSAGFQCPGSPQSGAFIRDVTMVMSDQVPPSVAASGPLLSGGVRRGTARLDVSAADRGAGLTAVTVLVNDQEVARHRFACAGPPMRPCPLQTAPLRFALDTEIAPFHDGANSVQACTADYGAPPNLSCTARENVSVDNSCAPSNVAGGTNLTAAFARNHRAVIHVKAGRGARLTGRLTDSAGQPVAGATLCTSEAVVGEPLARTGTVSTNEHGRYRYVVAPGPNRRVRIGYRHGGDQLVRGARFHSKARPKLRISPEHRTRNGKRIRLYGSIPGPRNRGRIVILQASRVGAHAWFTFRKARTDKHGNFAAGYRFTATEVTTSYRFRAVVPAQNGYPYDGGDSKPDQIKVIGHEFGL